MRARLLAAYGIALATPQQAALTGQTLAAARIQIGADPVFGPVVFFGQGGIAAEVAADRAAGLPPLNMALARDMVGRTRVSRLLAQGQTPADAEALSRTLVQVADMAADLPELAELDLNPLIAIGGGVVALGARLQLAKVRKGGRKLAIRPYPLELEQTWTGTVASIMLRPIRPEDAPQHQVFFNALDADDIRLRFFSAMRELPPAQLARLTQIDYDRAMAFIATRAGADGKPETLGVVRAVADPDNQSAEFAIIVRSDLKGKGLGYILFQKLVDYFRSHGTGEIVGDALVRERRRAKTGAPFRRRGIAASGSGNGAPAACLCDSNRRALVIYLALKSKNINAGGGFVLAQSVSVGFIYTFSSALAARPGAHHFSFGSQNVNRHIYSGSTVDRAV
jgi:acetyltransferase